MVLIKCRLCGWKFDHTDAAECNCTFGCGGSKAKCPHCGFDIDLPPGVKNEKAMTTKNDSIIGKLRDLL